MSSQNFSFTNRLNATLFSPIQRANITRTALLNMVIVFIGLFPNCTIILGTHFKKSLRKNTYYFMANLACCDLLLGISLIIHFVLNIYASPNLMSPQAKLIVCKIFIIFPSFWSYTASIQTLIIISIERYRAVFRPTKKLNRKKAIWLCILAWAVSFIISFPFIITTNLVGHQCVPFTNHNAWVTIINMILVTFQFIIPAVVMMFSYSAILHQLRKKNLNVGHESLTNERLKRKTIYMLILTTVTFLLLALPWTLSLILEAFTGRFVYQLMFDNSRPAIQLIIQLSRIGFPLSTVYNSIIYCFFNRQIRRLFFPCCYWRSNNTIHTELNSHIRSDTHTNARSTHTGAGNNQKLLASKMTIVAIE